MTLPRDLGYLEPAQQTQLEALIDVDAELGRLPVGCAVCRLVCLDAAATAVRLGLGSRPAPAGAFQARLAPTVAKICARVKRLLLFGVMRRRRHRLNRACEAFMGAEGRAAGLTALAAQLAAAAAARTGLKPPAAAAAAGSSSGASAPLPAYP